MANVDDSYDLERFVAAQDQDDTYAAAVAELRAGRKTSHWIWFVFPQVAGLGQSAMSKRYAISSLDEATAYMRHPVLGRRLVECAAILTGLTDVTAVDVLGRIDAQKVRSSMTLFRLASPDVAVFAAVLARWFNGIDDDATTHLL